MLVAKNSIDVATIERLPRGTAFHAARTPISKDFVKVTSISKQYTGPPAATIVTSAKTSGRPMKDIFSADPIAPPTDDSPRRGTNLARLAARRVTVWKKSEQERRDEEERLRIAKQELETRRQNHAVHAKHRRRAEIYALNALLRQVQQDKIVQYINAQKQLLEADKESSLARMAGAQVQTVGV